MIGIMVRKGFKFTIETLDSIAKYPRRHRRSHQWCYTKKFLKLSQNLQDIVAGQRAATFLKKGLAQEHLF